MNKLLAASLLLCACAPSPAAPPVAAAPASKPTAVAPAAPKSDSTKALVDSASKKEHIGDLDGARADYETAYAQAADDPEIIAALARVIAGQGQFDAANKLISMAIKAHPDAAALWLSAAGIARAQKRFGDAVIDARHVLMRNQANVQALALIALIDVDQNKFDLAEVYCGNALKLAPNSAELFTTLGYIYYKRGDNARALLQLQKAAKGEGNPAAAHADIGFIALAHRDYALAKSELEQAQNLGRTQKNVMAGECYAIEGTRNGKEAAACFNDLVSRVPASDPDAASYYFSLGQIQQTLNKDNAAALAAYKRYVELKGAALSKNDKILDVIKSLQDNAPQPGNKIEDKNATPSAMNAGQKPAASGASAKASPRS